MNAGLRHLRFSWLQAVICLAISSAAHAQSGAFSGTTSEGSDIYIEFITDPTNGAPQIFFYPSAYQMQCEAGNPRAMGGAYYVPITPIAAGWAFSLRRRDVAISGELTITPDGNSLKGKFNIAMPLFTDILTSTDSVTRCKTRPIGFQATPAPSLLR